VEIDAFAKINLFLAVLDKRADGYHNIMSVMQSLSLHDSLCISKTGTTAGNVTLETNENFDDNNLIVRAATRVMKECNIIEDVHIKLTKRIPIGAGLGGGSSDAAATLHGINQLFGLGLSIGQLANIGKDIGADVPFCVYAKDNATIAVGGFGDKVLPISPHPPCYVVLACPQIHVSTGEIFSRLSQLPQRRVDAKHRIAKLWNCLDTGDIAKISSTFYNQFTFITANKHKHVYRLIDGFMNNNALGASMTGTGATVFAYFDNENNACSARDKLEQIHKDTKFFVTATR